MQRELARVKERLSELGIETQGDSGSEIVIPALRREVGDVVICVDSNEFIVRVGTHFHHHFEVSDDSPDGLAELVQFVADFVNDHSVLTLRYAGSRLATAQVKNVETGQTSVVAYPRPCRSLLSRVFEAFRDRSENTRSFRWLGPVSDPNSPSSTATDGTSTLARQVANLNPDELKALAVYLAKRAHSGDDQPK